MYIDPTRAFSWLKELARTFKFKTLAIHFAKKRSPIIDFGTLNKGHKGGGLVSIDSEKRQD